MTVMPGSLAHETIGTERLHRLGWGEVVLWAFAFLAILAVQAIAALIVASWRTEMEVPGAPPPAIMIELSELAVAPQVEDLAADDGELSMPQEPAEAAKPVPAETVPEEVLEPLEPPADRVLEAETETAEALLPEPLDEAIPAPAEPIEPTPAEPPLDGPVEPEEVLRPEPIEPLPEAEPVEQVIPDLVEAEAAEVDVPMPLQMPASLEEKRRAHAEQRAVERRKQERQAQEDEARQAAATASQQTAPRSVEAKASEQTAAAEQTTTTKRTPSVSPEKWQSQLNAHLNRNKRYPAEARRQRQQGIPQLQFSIDASGNVLSARIIRSSGFPALDEAALEMINRASPVPAPPAAMARSKITLTVPVNFNLR